MCNDCYTGKVILHIACACVLALFMQHAMRMRRIVIGDLSGSTTLFHIIWQTARFSKNVIEHEMCVFIFSINLPETFLILRRIERDMIKIVYWSSSKVSPFLVDSNETWIFSTDFRKIPKYQVSWKSVQWEPSCSMRTDGQTWRS
jgi:hypothetical protein